MHLLSNQSFRGKSNGIFVSVAGKPCHTGRVAGVVFGGGGRVPRPAARLSAASGVSPAAAAGQARACGGGGRGARDHVRLLPWPWPLLHPVCPAGSLWGA